MVGEKAAELIRDVEPLPPSNAPAWIDEQWRERQRSGQPQRPAVRGLAGTARRASDLG